MRAFLSYTRAKDQFNAVSRFREHLTQELQLLEVTAAVFQDTSNLGGGSHFPQELETELKRSDILVVLLSPAWLQSDWCRREFEIFTDYRRDIVPPMSG